MKELKFIIFFLVGALLVAMTLGEKVLFWYLVLVLASMIVTNWSKLKDFIGK